MGEKQYVGVNRSIKLAQRAAAQTALDDHKHLSPTDTDKPELKSTLISSLVRILIEVYFSEHQSPTVALNTWAAQHYIPTQYILLNEQYFPPLNSRPQTVFCYRLYVGHDLYFDGYGSSHQRARTNCAHQALTFIDQNQMSDIISILTQVNLSYRTAMPSLTQTYLTGSSQTSDFADV